MGSHHDHDHDHNDPTAAADSWRNPDDDRPVSVGRRRFLAGFAAAAGAAALSGPLAGTAAAQQGHQHGSGEATSEPRNPWSEDGAWFAGDHHIHTQFSPDAQYEVETQVVKAREYGLDWMVITDHGGVAHQKLSIDQITPNIEEARSRHGDMLVFQGLEWNIPGAEHATVFLPPGRNTVDILKAFEGAYDGVVLATPVSQGGLGKITRATSNDGEPYALQALRYLDAQVLSGRTEIALMFANHPARRGLDSPHEIRNWREMAPDVAVGMEGAPGHQAAGIAKASGGGGGARGYYDKAPDPDSFPGYNPSQRENPYRSYGGFDWMTAKVGGLWDSLLTEGVPWWITATSDSHQVFQDTFVPGKQDHSKTGNRGLPFDTGKPQPNGDFWPGYYSNTLVGADSKSYLDIMSGLQAGKIIAVHGRLIDGLNLRVRAVDGGDNQGVTIGGRTFVRRGCDVEVTIDVTLAGGPNFGGEIPQLAKVDLIAGPVLGPVTNRDTLSAPTAKVVKTFEVAKGARGRATFVHVFRGVDGPFYLRLRGSDGKRLTSDGHPVMDMVGNADPFGDLWFYANPVFVDVI
jgi:hypothetical protein